MSDQEAKVLEEGQKGQDSQDSQDSDGQENQDSQDSQSDGETLLKWTVEEEKALVRK